MQFSEADRVRVNEAIRQAESATSAEIVPVVARSSGRYDRPEDIVGLWVAGLAIILVWFLTPLPVDNPGDFGARSAIWQLVTILIAGLIGFIAGAFLATRVHWLRRLFTPRVQMRDEVRNSANAMFFDKRIHHTGGGSGVLLYVSLFEQTALVLADQSVLEKLGPQALETIDREFMQRLNDNGVIDALCETARSVGAQLSPLLPRAADDVNELPDALVVIE